MSKDWPLFSSPVGMQRSFQRVHSLHQFKKSIQQGLGNLSFSHLFFPFLLKIAHFKQRLWGYGSSCSWFKWIAFKKREIRWKKFLFLYVFHCFPPFYAQKQIAPIALFSRAKEWFARAGNLLIWFPSESLVFCPKNERMSNLHKKMSEWAICS